jgi:hypothetical protein
VCHVSLPSSYRSRRGHIHLLRVLPLVGCRSKTPTSFLSTIELVLYELFVFELVFELFVFELSTHLCTTNIIVFGVVFLCITTNYWLGVVFNTNLCQHHAKTFISSKPEDLFQCTGFNYLPSGINPYRSSINILYRGIPLVTVCIGDFGLKFEFER